MVGSGSEESVSKQSRQKKKFPNKLPLSLESLMLRIDEDKLFGYLQCDLEVPQELYERLANFPPVFEIINVGRNNT